jgi:hypothetical protein
VSEPSYGTCRYCRCHGEACTLPNGDKCAWVNADCTLCSAPGCQRAETARLRTVSYDRVKAKYAGWGYGAIQMEKRKQRAARRKRQRAKRRAA